MKVLLATFEYPPAACGGIGIFLHGLARELTALGAEVRVVACDPDARRDREAWENGVRVTRVAFATPAGRRTGLLRFDAAPFARARALGAAVRRASAEWPPDVVETHDWAAPVWRPPARPLVVRLHGASSVLAYARGERASRVVQWLEGRLLARATAVVAASEWVLRKTRERFPFAAEGARVIPNGVDAALFSPRACERREEVVYAGTLREDKGVPELLRALETVLRKRPRACATLAGGPDLWREIPPSIRRLVERIRLTAPNRLRLAGRVSQETLAELYSRAGACVFPSRAEAFGLACVEAMSCEAAVVASTLGAAEEMVEHERSGLLADPRDPEALAGAVERLLREPETARRLGDAARRRAVERYSLRAAAERTLALYEELRSREAWRTKRTA